MPAAQFLRNTFLVWQVGCRCSTWAADSQPQITTPVHAEIVVYGGTPSGVMAAIAAARRGHSVALIDINTHVGGVVSGGLVASDMGDRSEVEHARFAG